MIQLMRNLPRRIASLDDEFLNTSDHLLKDDDDGDATAYDDDHFVSNFSRLTRRDSHHQYRQQDIHHRASEPAS